MKKTLLCLFALLLSVTAANAQKVFGAKNAPANIVNHKSMFRTPQPLKAPSVPNRIALDEDERLMGFYNTDELDMSGYSSLGLTSMPGDYSVGAIFSPEDVSGFGAAVGGQITKVRFAVAESIGATMVNVYPVSVDGMIGESVSSVEVPSTQAGWNDVTLTNPVTIEPDTYYLISYDYTQTSRNYPLLSDVNINPNGETDNGFLVLGNLGQGYGWYIMADAGNLCIQFVVKGGNFIDDDITLKGIKVDGAYLKSGENLSYSVGIMNIGNNVPESYSLAVSLDGTVVETLESPVQLTSIPQYVEGNVALPADMTSGQHNISVAVATINGKVPTENTADDKAEANFYVYTESMPRQKNLVEEFTSTACPYCPLGHDVLNKLIDMREDLAVAVLHNNYPGVSTLGTTETDELSYYLCNNGYSNPSGTFNRYYVDDASVNTYGSLNLVLSYQTQYATQAAQMFSSIIDESNQIPAFASVDIATDYDEASRKLNITVSGNSVDGFSSFVGEDAVLTVYVTEDDIVAAQSNNGVMDRNYVHNNVVRDIVSTSIFGDPIAWIGSNAYSNTYTITLDEEWNVDNMHVVAFISRPMVVNGNQLNSYEDMWVNNANSVKIDLATGIDGVESDGEAVKEVARYSVDGARISAPVKGINIIKMSDGTTRKVMIAE